MAASFFYAPARLSIAQPFAATGSCVNLPGQARSHSQAAKAAASFLALTDIFSIAKGHIDLSYLSKSRARGIVPSCSASNSDLVSWILGRPCEEQ